MSEEDFIGRWSRRKREAARAGSPPEPEPERAEASPADLAAPPPADVAAPDGGASEAAPAVDLEALPSLDSISAATDVTAFLREGVPLELSRAALRRAWSADPAIRDFVGLAENAWDFTDPDAMPGFGPLDCSQEQLRELVAKVIGDTQRAVADLAGDAAAQDRGSPSPNLEIGSAPELSAAPAPSVAAVHNEGGSQDEPPAPSDAAAQSAAPCEAGSQPVRISGRVHGGALPR